jgi:two-component system, OmpR family, KDP operon response regulator KdpE
MNGQSAKLRRTEPSPGESLRLTPTEYALLAQLVKHAGKVVTLKQLLRSVWGPQSEQQSNYLRVYANHLRKKLEGSGLEIKNEPGIGYRLVGG